MPPASPHQTIGSDILAVLHTLKFPEQILGEAWVARLRALDPAGWYPIELMLDLLKALATRGGHASLVQMGRQLFRDSHQKRLTPTLHSAGDVVFGIGGMYQHANRGTDIGGWQVLGFSPGLAVLKKTTPHHCALEEGILHEALTVAGASSLIVQRQCVQQGAPWCELELRSPVRDARWMGAHPTVS